jgi:hypothetical protein
MNLAIEHLDRYLRMGVDAGTAQTLDNLVTYMQRRAAVVTEQAMLSQSRSRG